MSFPTYESAIDCEAYPHSPFAFDAYEPHPLTEAVLVLCDTYRIVPLVTPPEYA
mgnify:CR=1 FL=1